MISKEEAIKIVASMQIGASYQGGAPVNPVSILAEIYETSREEIEELLHKARNKKGK